MKPLNNKQKPLNDKQKLLYECARDESQTDKLFERIGLMRYAIRFGFPATFLLGSILGFFIGRNWFSWEYSRAYP